NIVKETERLSHLITQVLNLEKYESGKQRLIYTSFNYNEMIDNTIASLQPLWQQKNIQIKKIIPNSELIIYADKNMLIQVLNNLLSNAIKFAPNQNGIITVRVNEIDGEISTEIEDNGKGIEKDLLLLIFDKFFQAKNQTLKKPEGSGLGLAICKKIIEMHQGKIWVESEVNKYTKFLFTLPIQNII
ncbi:MAG: HAMP domain-containing histidine kinase, partial [Chitinophagales bacterium]|nr:HAMP domain-containing histidine kinase [Chitinophagales bacterium]